MINRIGYACINVTLRQEENVKVNRKMIRKTWLAKGLPWASELALSNVKGVARILQWNADNNIKLYRMSSTMFSWMSEYELSDLPDYKEICQVLKDCGDFAKQHDMRISFHPGAFTILASPKQPVIEKAIKELDQHSEIMDLMGLSATPFNKINIHIGGAYGDKPGTLARFSESFKRLQPNTQRRLTIENDDRQSLYTVKDLMAVHNAVGIPIVFDFHHYNLHPGDQTLTEAYEMALSTWPDGIVPAVHMSSSRQLNEDSTAKSVAHADYIYEEIPTGEHLVDVVCETKQKELSVLRYLSEYSLVCETL
jgi:UV DNA damage endonuclease